MRDSDDKRLDNWLTSAYLILNHMYKITFTKEVKAVNIITYKQK